MPTLVGRWWRHDNGRDVEIDVLGIRGHRTTLIGGARWSARPLPLGTLTEMQPWVGQVPSPAADILYVLWSRAGVDPEITRRGARSYVVADMLS